MMPIRFTLSVLMVTLAVVNALWPRPTRGPRATPSFVLGTVAQEIPFLLTGYLLLISWAGFANGEFSSPGGIAAAALAGLTILGLLTIIIQSARALPAMDAALDQTLGSERPRARASTHMPRSLWALVAPLRIRDPRVRRIRNISYGPFGAANLLDVYRRRNVTSGPVFVYFHPGGFRSGSKNRQSKLLLETLALNGWVCVSANYRLRTAFLDSLADAKRVLAWVRTQGAAVGADPETLVIGGGSAGAHLATHCAVSSNHPELQPGFPDADTSVSAVVGLYGYYGSVYGQPLSDATEFADRRVPPMFIVHGVKDPMAPVAISERLVSEMRARGEGPIAYAELPGAGHNFDLMASLRHSAVATSVLEFCQWVVRRAA